MGKVKINSIWIDPKTQRTIRVIKRQSDIFLVKPITNGQEGRTVHHIRPWILQKFYKLYE